MHAPDSKLVPQKRPFVSQISRFASGEQTPREFLEECLATFDEWEGSIGAFVNVNIGDARAAADRSATRWRAGQPLSPIDGMPMGIKDIIETADMPTEMGSPLFAGYRSYKDAANVTALRDAGAVIIGKTVTTEFAASEPRGTRNPWNLDHTPGGSSSGSAASVACGIVSAALGTQVVGSTIRPASFCGVYGFKPTVGGLNRQGCHDYQSQSATGVLAATLEDMWQVAYEIVSRVGGDAGHPGLVGPDRAPRPAKPTRLAFLETSGWEMAGDGARNLMQEALEKLTAAGIEIITRHDDAKVATLEGEIEKARALTGTINAWETRWFLQGCADRDASLLSEAILGRYEKSKSQTLAGYRADIIERARIRSVYAELTASCDACVTLSAPGAAPAGLQDTGSPLFAIASSLLGIPALTLPVFQIDGMPLGLQVLGFANEDARAFANSAWLVGHLHAANG